VGVGETTEIDGRGRITIPSRIRRRLRGRKFRIELLDQSRLLVDAVYENEELVGRIKRLRLHGNPKRAGMNAALAKDIYGGIKE